MTDVIVYPGSQQWRETRKHWHTTEFAGVVDAKIARGVEPKAYVHPGLARENTLRAARKE